MPKWRFFFFLNTDRQPVFVDVACIHACTCRKLMAISMRLYELIPPVKTSFRSLCSRNCFRTKIRGGRTVYFYKTGRPTLEITKNKDTCVENVKYSKAYLKIAFDELCCFNSSFYIEADVHFHLSFMVGKLDDWHLRTGQTNVHI